jgi:hypothetical protein
MNMNMNMSNDRDQDQDQIKNKSQNQSQTLEQEQESRLFAMLTTPCQLHETWTEFLLEVLCELEEAGLIKRISHESEDKNDEYECEYKYLKKDPNLRRRRTVSPICRYSERFGYKKVPFIRLSGYWLEEYGFFVGQRFLVYPKKDQLLLKRTSRCSDWLLLSKKIKNRT